MSCRKENEWTRKSTDGLAISESLLKSAYSGHPLDLQSSQGEQMSSDTRSDAKKNAMLTRILEDSDYLDALEPPYDDNVVQLIENISDIIQKIRFCGKTALSNTEALAVLRQEAPQLYKLYAKVLGPDVVNEAEVNRVPRELASGFLERTKWQLMVKVERSEIWLNLIFLIVFLLLFVYDVYVKAFWLAGLNGIIVVILLVRLFKSFNSFKKHKELFARKLGGSY
jgi:hypothetical protein